MKTQKTLFLEKVATIKMVRMGYWVVYPEVFANFNCGQLDLVGAKIGYAPLKKVETLGVEIKVSRADFFGRKQKFLHERSKLMTGDDGVNYKYFFTPKGLIKKEELYDGWGLMEYDNGRVFMTVKAPRMEVNNEMTLYYMARVPIYVYHQNKTGLCSGYYWSDYPVEENK